MIGSVLKRTLLFGVLGALAFGISACSPGKEGDKSGDKGDKGGSKVVMIKVDGMT